MNNNQNLNYEKPDDIRIMKWPECCRENISRYLGGTDSEGLSNAFREIIDNAIDECYQSSCNTVFISKNFNGYSVVFDNGRGIPITYSKDEPTRISADVAISVLHAGSKFSENQNVTVGVHGEGSSCTCACSDNYILLSKIDQNNCYNSLPAVKELWDLCKPRERKDLYYIVWYKKGIKFYEGAGKKSDLEKIMFPDCKRPKEIPSGFSTLVFFQPDRTIFNKTAKINLPIQNLQYFLLIEKNFFKKKVNLFVDGKEIVDSGFVGYQFGFTKRIVPKDTSSNKYIDLFATFEVDPGLGNKTEMGSVNGLTVDSGQHIIWTEKAFEESLKKNFGISHKYTLNGLRLCVILLASSVGYSSQTKERLKTITKVTQDDVLPFLIKEFDKAFKSNSEYWQDHVDRLNFLANSMKSLSAADKSKALTANSNSNSYYKLKNQISSKFTDATAGRNDRWNCSLYIVEGDSAASGLKRGRTSSLYQGILPLRGKVKNTSDLSIEEMLENEELKTLYSAIGLGTDEYFIGQDAETPEERSEIIRKNARFSRIIISTDADPDGDNIAQALVYCLYKYSKFLFEEGMIYRAESPIYIQGKNYIYPDDPKDSNGNYIGLDLNKHYKYIKGLGGLDPEDIAPVFYNPGTSRIRPITMEGAEYACKLIEDIETRKGLLISKNIITNPFNIK